MKLSILNIIFTCFIILTSNSHTYASISNKADMLTTSGISNFKNLENQVDSSIYRSPNIEVVFTENICEGVYGNASLIITGASGPFLYEWSTGDISPEITYNYGGPFWVKVTDTHDNTSTIKKFNVNQHPNLEIEITSKNIDCFEKQDGKAKAIVTNGTSPYQYIWNTSQTTQEIKNLSPGEYSVVVTDKYGCSGTASTEITSPEKIILNLASTMGICSGLSAELVAEISGGVGPYSFSWNDDASINEAYRVVSPTETFTYTLVATDSNGCKTAPKNSVVTVSQPIVITPEISPIKCHGVYDAKAILNIEGGTPPFSYSWESPTNTISNLSPGIYNVTITDRNECTGETIFTIKDPELIEINKIISKPKCHDSEDGMANLIVTGGVPFTDDSGNKFYNYTWNTGHNGATLLAGSGNYNVTITDAIDCVMEVDVKIEEQDPIYTTPLKDGTICKGETFSTTCHASGGVSPYLFTWYSEDMTFNYNGETLTVSPILTTKYNLEVTDKNNCSSGLKPITVFVNPAIKINSISVVPQEICFGDTVTINADIEGGNGGPYSIKLDYNESISLPYEFVPEESGNHFILVEDFCKSPSDKKIFSIKVNPLPNFTFYSDKTESCIPGTFEFYESSNDVNNTYSWSFGDSNTSTEKTPTHTYYEDGFYSVSLTAISEFGCKKSLLYEDYIEIYPNPKADFTSDPISSSILDPHIRFINQSVGANEFFINYGDDKTSLWQGNSITHFYNDIGKYMVELIAISEHGCADTIKKPVTIHDDHSFYAPTAFTPNGDGLNDLFYITGKGIETESFLLRIYDRYGMQVFETKHFDSTNPETMAWDGTIRGLGKGDKVLSNGVYSWFCVFYDSKGQQHFKSGNITLIK